MAEAYLSQARFAELIARFPQSNVAVIGDFFLDEYLILDKELREISLETGLEAQQVTATRKAPGVAGTVTNILRSLEVPVMAIGFSGDDGHGFELRRGLQALGINLDHFAVFPDRFTPTYTKPMLLENGRETEQSRLDTKNRLPLQPEHEKQLIQSLRTVLPQAQAVLAIDQAKGRNCGVITDAVRAELAALAEQYPGKVFMADSRDYMHLFKNSIVKFNVHEASRMFGLAHPDHSPEFVADLSQRLFAHYHQPILLTLGADGMQVTDQSGSARIPGIPVTGPTDIVGAGDSVMASAGAALSVGATLIEAAIIGNLTASLIIQQIGTTGIATRQQLQTRFDETREWLNATIQVSAAQISAKH
jgi:rfaE bifunctional protein kinase chain/domain